MISWSTWWARLSCRGARYCRWAHWLWSWWPAKLCCLHSALSCWRVWTLAGRPDGTSPGKKRAPSTKWWLNHRSRTVTHTPRKCTTILTHQRTRSTSSSHPVAENTTADIRCSHIDGLMGAGDTVPIKLIYVTILLSLLLLSFINLLILLSLLWYYYYECYYCYYLLGIIIIFINSIFLEKK